MLRALFGEPRRKDEGRLAEANRAIKRYMNALTLVPAEKQTAAESRFLVWGESFLRALDELEQSQFAAERCARQVKSAFVDQMSTEERDDYYRYLYFYRNAIIRMFSILDKLGYFMNERFMVEAGKVKARFSYFTVLRTMHQRRIHAELEDRLYKLKQDTKEPVSRLRNQRNVDIHTINADLLDELMEAEKQRRGVAVRQQTDELEGNLQDLEQGVEMTCRAVSIVFAYLLRQPSREQAKETRQTAAESRLLD